MREEHLSKRENLINALELPRDLVLGMPYLNFCGNRELVIENHRGILNYDTSKLIVTTKVLLISIEGRGLCVEQYTMDTLKVTGFFESIRFAPC